MKKFLIALLALALVFAFTGCDTGGGDPNEGTGGSGTGTGTGGGGGGGNTHIHSYGTTWSYNGTQHYKQCSCGEKIDVENHVGNPCAICGYTSGGGGGGGDTTYAVTVNNGVGSNNFAVGVTVVITANEPPAGQQFKNWTTTSAGVVFANANSASTSFTMPANAVTVTANFEAAAASLEPSHFYGKWRSVDGSGGVVYWEFTATKATFSVSGYSAVYSISEWRPVTSTGADSATYPSGFRIIANQTGGSIVLNTRYFFASATSNNHMAAADGDVLYGSGIPSNNVYLIFQRQ